MKPIPLIDPLRLGRVRDEVDAEVSLLATFFSIRLPVARQCMAGNLGYGLVGEAHPSGCAIATAISLDEIDDEGFVLDPDGALPWAVLRQLDRFRTVVRTASARLDDAETALLCLLLDRDCDLFYTSRDLRRLGDVRLREGATVVIPDPGASTRPLDRLRPRSSRP
ncbi:MAG: hypothetical protein KDA25_07910, partial [Phycisphaerales bacterium]|nr:hypothetical protein [Phycisphaerales bacterium]